MGQNQNNTGNSSKIASIFGKRRIAQSQPVSMIMDSNAPVAPVKKKAPIIPIIIIVVIIAIIFGIVMLVINSMKTAKSEALASAYADCVSIFYDNGNIQDLRTKAQEDQELAKKVNDTNSWYIKKISSPSNQYSSYDVSVYGEKVLTCLDDLEKAYNESWQQNETIGKRIEVFSQDAHIYADYMKLNLSEDSYYDFYIAHENKELLDSFKNKANETSNNNTKRLYNTLVKKYEAEKKYATFANKNRCFVDAIISRDCISQFNDSQIFGNMSAQKVIMVNSARRELETITNSLISSLRRIGDIVWF